MSQTRTIQQGKGQSWEEVPGSQRHQEHIPSPTYSGLLPRRCQDFVMSRGHGFPPAKFSPLLCLHTEGSQCFAKPRVNTQRLQMIQNSFPQPWSGCTLSLNRTGHFFLPCFLCCFSLGVPGVLLEQKGSGMQKVSMGLDRKLEVSLPPFSSKDGTLTSLSLKVIVSTKR